MRTLAGRDLERLLDDGGRRLLLIIKNVRSRRARELDTSAFGDAVLETETPDELAQAAAEVARRRPSLVVIVGGDGSVTTTLSALAQIYGAAPPFRVCLIPGGTMNTIARSIGVTDGKRALGRLHRAISEGEPLTETRRTAISVGQQVGLLFGLGLAAHFLEEYNRGGRGAAAVWRLLVAASAEAVAGRGRWFQPFEARLTVDDQPWRDRRWVNVSAGGVHHLGVGFAPFTRATERDGAFHLIAHDLSPLGAVRELPRIRMGMGMRDVQQTIASLVTVETDRPVAYALDGEVFPARDRFVLRGGPLLRFVVP